MSPFILCCNVVNSLWSVLEIKYDNQIRKWNDPAKPSSDIYYGGVIASQGYPTIHFGYEKPLLWLYFLQETDVYVTFTLHSPSSLLVDRLVALKTEGPNSWLPVFSVNQSTPVSVLVRYRQGVQISYERDEEYHMHPAFLLRFNGKCQQWEFKITIGPIVKPLQIERWDEERKN